MTIKHLDKPCANSTIAYYAMLILGVTMVVFATDYAMGASLIALAIVFYPHEKDTHWRKMTMRSKSMIMLHMIVAAILIVLSLMKVVR